jgi:hypothetical protein
MPGPAPARTPAKQPPAAPAAASNYRRTNTTRKERLIMLEERLGQEKHSSNSLAEIDYPRIFSYNLNEDERPGGLKVRYKIRVVSGRKAAVLDARQAEAIGELLVWVRQHRSSPGAAPDGTPTAPA